MAVDTIAGDFWKKEKKKKKDNGKLPDSTSTWESPNYPTKMFSLKGSSYGSVSWCFFW